MESLTLDDRKLIAMDALMNWCANTETHLREARRLRAERERLPATPDGPFRRWIGQTAHLIRKMADEIKRAEPDTADAVGDAWDKVTAGQFLDQVADAD